VRAGVIVIDREMHVIAWNHRAEDLWGLRADEARGQNFLNLDIGLPVQDLRADIRVCLSGEREYSEQTLAAINRRGKPITLRVTMTPIVAPLKEIRGAILMMDETAAA